MEQVEIEHMQPKIPDLCRREADSRRMADPNPWQQALGRGMKQSGGTFCRVWGAIIVIGLP